MISYDDTGLLVSIILFVLFVGVCYELLLKPRGRSIPTAKDIENARFNSIAAASEHSALRLCNDAKCALLIHAQRGNDGPVKFLARAVSVRTIMDAQQLLIKDGFTCAYTPADDGYTLSIDVITDHE